MRKNLIQSLRYFYRNSTLKKRIARTYIFNRLVIAYNDIIEFSELYYQNWTIPQRVINYRLNSVYKKAISD